ncbi:NAD-dependent succinate-semialdehyde dehydrogenase [Ochrobactrum sp. MR28]|uniref:Succinate-semialdehyde dehydrogenase/glutarate-semialdehyde dehydrogenase n=2 Tax=Pseudochrobactrum asaccharolyticum TaxID=354351 RepID=A0A366DKF3_9HYPH|nr:NAD-dependent succinate-semialdehyde dehydrogenase [Pseudochrobactrum asaccharolyticum]MBX8802359.1 NAD-dependent succinate-semialdehyde dehydrogenase [Ochrobactrum sp. MR28]MBX8817877.1 NAD-dependent succinate-semialdehyde dehydrogenase [Ochrobactrum sp. MR31]RBO90415.1 succinate-semialdehyde dehydrogenase/glutarate-semialdehyde dehydrogenase [Pseudochrobactrum asaccharolyticum]
MTLMTEKYGPLTLFIDGEWISVSDSGEDVYNPATGEVIARLPHASASDIDRAAQAAARSFPAWRALTALERSRILRRTADLLRERADHIAWLLSTEQGKALGEARIEVMVSAETLDWCAEEGRRIYGRIVPSPYPQVEYRVLKQPVGPVAAFTPWNFPLMMPARKVASALASGCTIVLKPAEETPAAAIELARAFHDAGLPDGVLNIVFGNPAEVSEQLIAHEAIRKVTFTGSTAVGQHLAGLAARHGAKRCTMELGGHAPVLILEDADLERAISLLAPFKFRNAGQVCISPTRFYVHDSLHDRFVDGMVCAATKLKIGSGVEEGVQMGPLANPRRVSAMRELVDDAIAQGARCMTGGNLVGNRGNFFAPTVLADVPESARIMNEEPFGPIVVTARIHNTQEAITQANRLPFGLASYAFTSSAHNISMLADGVEAGMLGVNAIAVSTPEAPFGGVRHSGYGSEGGIEGMEPYLVTKLLAQG